MMSENSEFLKKKKGRILTFLRILDFENYIFVLFVYLFLGGFFRFHESTSLAEKF